MAITGVKLPENLREEFEDLGADHAAVMAKYENFSKVIHEEQKQLSLRAKDLWLQTIYVMGLEGEWYYKEGLIYPVDEPGTK